MAATNINRVVLTGNLTRDPELRSLPSGMSVCSLRIASNSRRKENGEWVETPAMQVKTEFDFEAVGKKNAYLMYHEELESLAKFVPELERARFWMTFGDAYITHLTVLQNVGMTSIEPIRYQGKEIIPLQFLAAVLPKPETLGETTKGNTNIGVIATGEAVFLR